jgi:hypothetical protein
MLTVQSTLRIRTEAPNLGKKDVVDQGNIHCKLDLDIAAILTLNNNQLFIQYRSGCVCGTFLKSFESFTR